MKTRQMTTLEVFRLIDSLQAAVQHIDHFCSTINDVVILVQAVGPLLHELQEQSQFEPAVEGYVDAHDPTLWHGPKYKNEVRDFLLSDEQWALADRLSGKFSLDPHIEDSIVLE